MANSLSFLIYYCLIILFPFFNVWAEDLNSIAILQGSVAVLPLYGDVVKDGYSATNLHIGTPPQKFSLVVDTGSYMTFVPCSNCDDCGDHQDRSFEPEKSRTYHPVKCNSDCKCDYERSQCSYEMRYGEGSSSSGVLAKDEIDFGNERKFPAVFGCELQASGDLKTQKADGIMGLSRNPLALIDQLAANRLIDDSFSLCFGGMDVGRGVLVIGAYPPPSDMVFSYSNTSRSPYYNIELTGIHVAGEPLELDPTVFDQDHGTIVDSGTTFAFLPNEAFLAFKHSILEATSSLEIIDAPNNDICFRASRRDAFPEVKLVFRNNQRLSLSPENYLFRSPSVSDAYCLGIYPNDGDSTTMLGGIITRNTLVTYDRGNSAIGFWKTDCHKLSDKLNNIIPYIGNGMLGDDCSLPFSSYTKPNQTLFKEI